MNTPAQKESATKSSRPQATRKTEALLVQLLIKQGLFLHRELNQVCQQYELNTNQFSAINEIILQGPLSQKELCERLLFEKSNVSKIVKSLLDKNLITVSVPPNDRRSTLLIETVQGTEIWNKCLRDFRESSAVLMSTLSEEEAKKTVDYLRKLELTFAGLTEK